MQFNLVQSCPDCEEIVNKIQDFNEEFRKTAAKILKIDASSMTLSQLTTVLNDNVDKFDGTKILDKHVDLYNSILAHSHIDDGSVVVRH